MSEVGREHRRFQSVLAKVLIPVIPVQLMSVSDVHDTCVSMLTTEEILKVWNCLSLFLGPQRSTLFSFCSIKRWTRFVAGLLKLLVHLS